MNFSGGERQRIGVTRAILKQPTILVFDEVTSALDAVPEHAIVKELERLSERFYGGGRFGFDLLLVGSDVAGDGAGFGRGCVFGGAICQRLTDSGPLLAYEFVRNRACLGDLAVAPLDPTPGRPAAS